MAKENLSIREAARRLGVSDVAIHKALKNNPDRIKVDTDADGKRWIVWPDTQYLWTHNGDTARRSHYGSQGAPRRANDNPVVKLTLSSNMDEEPQSPATAIPEPSSPGPKYAQSRAVRELYNAKKAKLEYEKLAGTLVDPTELEIGWSKLIQAAKTRLTGLPTACKTRYPDLPLPVVALIDAEVRAILEDLANGN